MDDILRRELESVGAKVPGTPRGERWRRTGGRVEQRQPQGPLLFIGHVDTVFKEGTAEDNPFRIDEQGRAHGPGVLDMKARPCHCRPRHQGPGCRRLYRPARQVCLCR